MRRFDGRLKIDPECNAVSDVSRMASCCAYVLSVGKITKINANEGDGIVLKLNGLSSKKRKCLQNYFTLVDIQSDISVHKIFEHDGFY